ncbi:hypothetical protein Acsp03_49790 [Actinomadura sp. NBRC 104412]|uniref:MmgE/PrpD family protein n=1 Tax=Actinomadura sp. NBRC 104412 TaxID=3032203 RepID=UPI0024A3E300|nr:MmgE/PrpD family protein [Actinomadura sp. NBRC 104412]GLZ07513.1 hypothetical protein Acsp03_49790 [Actinomadura sp. NBRC 104412]
MTLAQELARHVAGLDATTLPPDVVAEAKRRLLDFVAATAPAFDREAPARIATGYATRAGGAGEATVIVLGDRAPAPLIAFANGVAGSCLEIDDDHSARVGHVGTPTVPAALAAAELAGTSGAGLLAAIVAGYEVYVRTARAVRPGVLLGKGFQPSGTNGAFGAAAAAARALGLSSDRVAHAIGLAGCQSAGLIEGTADGTWSKRFNPGWAAHAGTSAALLADAGFTGAPHVLEGRHGWLAAYAGDAADAAAVLDGIGDRYEILGSVTKPYACSRYCHSAIDAALALRPRVGTLEEVESVLVHTFAHGLPFVARPAEAKAAPRTVVDAQFSLPFAVAVALADGAALLDQFTPESIARPEVRAIAAATTVTVDPELDVLYPRQYPARLEVRLRDGRTLTSEVRTPAGDPGNELDDDRFFARFTELATLAYPREQVDDILDAVSRLEELDHVRDLVSLLVRR